MPIYIYIYIYISIILVSACIQIHMCQSVYASKYTFMILEKLCSCVLSRLKYFEKL